MRFAHRANSWQICDSSPGRKSRDVLHLTARHAVRHSAPDTARRWHSFCSSSLSDTSSGVPHVEAERMKARFTALLAALAIVFAASTARAQSQTGEIFGKVTDTSGAVMPGVTVTLTGPSLLQPQTATTS